MDLAASHLRVKLSNEDRLTHVQRFPDRATLDAYTARTGLKVVEIETIEPEPAPVEPEPAPTVRAYARAETRCDGLKARIDREVSEAARSDDPDRLDRLRFWHRLQRIAHHVYYANSLCFAPSSGNEPPRFSGAGRYSCPSESWLNAEP